jgi:putative spermidine/putrescine transport system permease protein
MNWEFGGVRYSLWDVAWRSILLVFIAGPVVWASGYATAYSFGGVGRLSTGWTTKHWQQTFNQSQIMGSVVYSLMISLVVLLLIITITFGALVAWPRIRFSKLFLLLSVVMMGTPALVLAQMVINTWGPGGWVSRLVHHAGIIVLPSDFPTLVNDRYSVGVTIAITLSLLPLSLLYFSQLWDTARIDRCCQLAQSLGASDFGAMVHVALPMLINRGKAMLVLLLILVNGSYEIPLLLGRQSPQMFSVATQRLANNFDLSLKPQAYVLATLYFICVSLMLLVYIRSRGQNV